MVEVGISVPWDLWSLPYPDRQVRLAQIADAGIDHLFTADHVSFHGGAGIDGLLTLAALSGIEPRLKLQLGVMLLALRHPMVAARQIANLAEVAPGRCIVGVGVGGEDRHEFEVCGVDPRTRGRRTDAALDILTRLLAGETVDGDGEFFDFTEGLIRPTPPIPVPLLVGGRSDAALQRTAKLGDGWLASWCSARRFAQGVQQVESTGRVPLGGWKHALQVWVGVGNTKEQGRQFVAEGMESFYKIPFAAFEKYTPVGTPADIVDFLRPYVDSGAYALNLTPCGPSPTAEYEAIAEVRSLLR